MAFAEASQRLSLLFRRPKGLFTETSAIGASSPAYITKDSRKEPWGEIPHAETALLTELQDMYWKGVRRELAEIIRTLRAWRNGEGLKDVELEEEKEHEVCGFETFLDQVSENSREFAAEYAQEKARRMQLTARGEFVPYEGTLQRIARKLDANEKSRSLKKEIGIEANARVPERDVLKRRARMLLQSAAWLDMDKLIEHRPPIKEVGFWKRPTAPQLGLVRFDETLSPVFQPECCVLCRQIIRGSMFHCTVPECPEEVRQGFICLDCQHAGKHPETHLSKDPKRCVLAESIGRSASRQLCQCNSVARFDGNGQLRALFPVSKADAHRSSRHGAVACSLLGLPAALAEAKYQGVLMGMENKPNSTKTTTLADERRLAEKAARKVEAARKAAEKKGVKGRAAAHKTTHSEREAAHDIPFFMREITDSYPFGNVHMALRLGPLLVENGVEHSQGGALVTSRDPPRWQPRHAVTDGDMELALALSSGSSRRLYRQRRRGLRHPKRYKAALKQVVGGLFCGFCHAEAEAAVVALVAAAAASPVDLDSPEYHVRDRAAAWEAALAPILEALRALMAPRADVLLGRVAQRLLDPLVELKWDRSTNNCQRFCDSLIDYGLYGPLVAAAASSPPGAGATTPADGAPPYLISFVCRPSSYERSRRIYTKYDVPSGLCEEYLLRFRHGVHVDSDLIDSLLEYWHDWGAFGGPLYRYQALFPWDCTEAFSRSEAVCGGGGAGRSSKPCNLSKHVWSFPFDSWSIVELHLARPRVLYGRERTTGNNDDGHDDQHDDDDPSRSSRAWMRNRLAVLAAVDALHAAAVAMARSAAFRRATAWIGSDHNDALRAARKDRLKLGGIHRAQPFSHHYDEGRYHEYFLADWAHLRRADQVAEYEALRDARHRLHDLPRPVGGSGSVDGGGSGDSYDDYYDDWDMTAWSWPYYEDGWDGNYDATECMSATDAAALAGDGGDAGTADDGGDTGGDDGGDYGDDGGCGGGGDD